MLTLKYVMQLKPKTPLNSMKTYHYYLKLDNQGYPNEFVAKIITAKDEYEALSLFCEYVENNTKYLAIEDDMWYEEKK